MSRRRNRFLTEAQMEALVRFGPEFSGLAELGRTAREQRDQAIGSARGTAAGITAAVDRAVPEVQSVYNHAGLQQAAIAHTIEPDVNAAGVAPSIRAAAALEMGTAQERTGESRAASLTDLATRRVQAQSGKQFAIKAAQQQFRTDITKILNRLQDLRREQGAFTASTVDKLAQDAADRRLRVQIERMGNTQSERNSIRSSGIDPNTGRPIPGGKLDPKAKPKKMATPAQTATAADKVQEALQWARRFAERGTSLDDTVKILGSGTKEKPVYETVTDPITKKKTQRRALNPDGTPKVIPGIPKIDSTLLLTAAAEVAYYGHVSRKTIRALHRRGLRVDALGLPKPRRSNTGQVRPQTGSPV